MESYFTLRFIDELYSRLTVTPEPPRKVYSRHLDSRGCERSEHLSSVLFRIILYYSVRFHFDDFFSIFQAWAKFTKLLQHIVTLQTSLNPMQTLGAPQVCCISNKLSLWMLFKPIFVQCKLTKIIQRLGPIQAFYMNPQGSLKMPYNATIMPKLPIAHICIKESST